MKADCAEAFVAGLKDAGIHLVAILPDGWFYEVYQRIRRDDTFKVVPVSNEGEGVCVCAGAWLGGMRACILMENSGLRVASEALGRLRGIPALMFMSYRGDVGDGNFWAVGIGKTTEPLLRALEIPYLVVREPERVQPSVVWARRTLDASRHHAAVLYSGATTW